MGWLHFLAICTQLHLVTLIAINNTKMYLCVYNFNYLHLFYVCFTTFKSTSLSILIFIGKLALQLQKKVFSSSIQQHSRLCSTFDCLRWKTCAINLTPIWRHHVYKRHMHRRHRWRFNATVSCDFFAICQHIFAHRIRCKDFEQWSSHPPQERKAWVRILP
jgi:hypothetical protein